jgi:hypothetical protein
MFHRQVKASPEALLKVITLYRDGIVIAVEFMFTWYWLADLCAPESIPFIFGHALSMKDIHGGKAKNDRIDAHKIAVLLRGGMLPRAYVYPAEMRATRLIGHPLSLLPIWHWSPPVGVGCPSPEPGPHWPTLQLSLFFVEDGRRALINF